MSAVAVARRPPPLLDLVEESFDEAEFLWKSWESALASHARNLDGLVFWVEKRLLGSLDGVRLGGQFAHESLVLPALTSENAWRTTVAAHILASSVEAGSFDALMNALSEASREQTANFRRAVELADCPRLLEQWVRSLRTAPLEQRALYLDVCAFQGRDVCALALDAATDPSPILARAGLRALRRSPPEIAESTVASRLGSSSAAVALAAMETGLVLGSIDAWSACREIARKPSPNAARALLLLAQLGGAAEFTLLLEALHDETRHHPALFALGFAGTVAAGDACVQFLENAESARLAAEALCAISGLDLEQARMVAKETAPPQEPIAFEDEDLDADLVPSPEQLLPLPDAALVRRWWEQRRTQLAPNQRYLAGRPLTLDTLQHALECGPMRRRHAIALELAVRSHGRYFVQTSAFAATQRTQLRAFHALGGNTMQRTPIARYFSPA